MPIRKFVSSLFVIGVMILGSSGAAYADCAGVRCKRVGIGLYVRADNLINIDTSGDERRLTCLPRDGRYIDLQKNHPNYKEIYAALLAATISGRGLEIRIRSGTNGECQMAYISDNVNHETKFPYVAKGLPNPRGAIIAMTTDFLFDENTDLFHPLRLEENTGVFQSSRRICCRLGRKNSWMSLRHCRARRGKQVHLKLCRMTGRPKARRQRRFQ